MAISAFAYTSLQEHILSGGIDFESDTIKIAVVTSAYSSNTGHEFWSSVAAYEATADDYQAGTLQNVAITPGVNSTNVACDKYEWSGPTYATGRYLIVYKDSGDPTSSPLITCINLGQDMQVMGIDFGPNGVYRLTK